MPTSLQIDYDSIREQVALQLGMDRDVSNWLLTEADDVDHLIASGLRRFYGEPHEWSFLRIPYAFVTSAPYETGTIAVASGTVTLTGGTFPTWAASAWLDVSGTLYEVASRTNGTEIILVDTSYTVSAGTAYSLKQFRYELPSDYESAEGPILYHPERSAYTAERLDDVGFHRVRAWYQKYSVGVDIEPRMYCIYPKTFDATVGQRYYLELAPPSDAAHRLTLVYRSFGSQLDDTNKYPLGGAAHSETILAAILAECERRIFGASGEQEARYQESLAKSIVRDLKATNAEYLGKLRNPEYECEELYDWPVVGGEPIIYKGSDLSL